MECQQDSAPPSSLLTAPGAVSVDSFAPDKSSDFASKQQVPSSSRRITPPEAPPDNLIQQRSSPEDEAWEAAFGLSSSSSLSELGGKKDDTYSSQEPDEELALEKKNGTGIRVRGKSPVTDGEPNEENPALENCYRGHQLGAFSVGGRDEENPALEYHHYRHRDGGQNRDDGEDSISRCSEVTEGDVPIIVAELVDTGANDRQRILEEAKKEMASAAVVAVVVAEGDPRRKSAFCYCIAIVLIAVGTILGAVVGTRSSSTENTPQLYQTPSSAPSMAFAGAYAGDPAGGIPGFCDWGWDGTPATALCDVSREWAFTWCHRNGDNCAGACGGKWCSTAGDDDPIDGGTADGDGR